ncbi:MAG: hypothetical protein F6J90_41195 [Moorea sp. SIOASIH]|uniref:hypothetical protein n=1 Tax=Moorena sp. SIOASIH TaxID=2607817 RepID=UPI0013BB74BF|nr:hypothetical protein [Moorena sp. SIOASIH]NEO42394.1 hypothetical protein [Moorena sp. SIOASIH]
MKVWGKAYQLCGTGFGHATRMATLCERRWDVTQHYSNAYLLYAKAVPKACA